MKYEYRNPEMFPVAFFKVLRDGQGFIQWRYKTMDGGSGGNSAGYTRKLFYLFISSVSRTPLHPLRERALELKWLIEVKEYFLVLTSKPRSPAERALAEKRARPVEEGGGLGIPRLFERAPKTYSSEEAARRARSGRRQS